MPIQVVVVDDVEADRYIVKRQLKKAEDFNAVLECDAGDAFLESYFNDPDARDVYDPPLVVLMDVNMPRMNGFEAVEELQRRMAEGRGARSVVIMMFTSSDNPADRALAERYEAVKGYIVKPLTADDVETIRQVHHAA